MFHACAMLGLLEEMEILWVLQVQPRSSHFISLKKSLSGHCKTLEISAK